jgi:hypothetical protein
MSIKRFCISILILFSFLIISNQAFAATQRKVPTGDDSGKITPTDYSKAENWIAVTEKTSKKVDVFYIYPTEWRAKPGEFPISEITNEQMRTNADFWLKTYASAFEPLGNTFAPYYRQVDAYFVIEQTQKGGWRNGIKYFQGVPKTDIIAAFDYYIKHYNNGRPFILVGHSQGSAMIRELLMDYMKANPDVYKRMIAAYAIGFPFIKEDYEKNPHLKAAQGPLDLGVIISYNTESAIVDGQNPLALPDAVLINPISWKTDEELAPARKNIGSVIINKDGSLTKEKHIADAKINHARGTIICSTADREQFSSLPASRAYFPLGVLHESDILLYYYDLRENAKARIKVYLKAHKNK